MAANSIDSDQYVDGSIDTAHIADDAVTSAKLDTNIAIAGTLGVTGEITANGGIALGDGDVATFNSNLSIFSSGTTSYIQEAGAGDLYLKASSLYITDRDNNQFMTLIDNGTGGTVSLMHNTATKLATTATGIDVTGTATMDGLTVDGTGGLTIDNSAVNGAMTITNPSADLIQFTTGTNDDISFVRSGSERLRINSTGIDVTGTATMDGLTVSNTGVPQILIQDLDGTDKKTTLKHSNGTSVILSQNNFSHGTTLLQSSNGTTTLTRQKIDSNGDISFYEDTGSTAKLFWDASAESLGIGTTSPSAKLDIQMSDANGAYGRGIDGNLNLENTNTSVTEGGWLSISGYMGNAAQSGQYQMGAITGGKQTTAADGTYGGYLSLWTTSGGGNGEANSGMYERARIDSSGNLLVGKTSADSGVSDGSILGEAGLNRFTANSTHPLVLKRRTSNGTILQIEKDSTIVGSIDAVGTVLKVKSSSNLHLEQNGNSVSRSLNFTGTSFKPFDSNDNQLDLGTSSARFKDIYLSGGVYLGGTGAANKLDDYEEGTWTPNLTFGGSASGISWNLQSGSYVKIGNVVHLFCLLFEAGGRGSQTGNAQLTGLPFATSAGYPDSWFPLTNRSGITVSSDEQLALFMPRNTQTPTFYISRTVAGNNTTATHANFSASGVFEVSFTLTYRTD